MEGLMEGFLCASMIYFPYFIIRNINIRYVKWYFYLLSVCFLIILIKIFRVEEIGLDYLVLYLCSIGGFICLVKLNYKKDCRVKKLYILFSDSNLHPWLMNGLNDMKDEKIDECMEMLQKFIDDICSQKIKNITSITTEKYDLIVSIIMWKHHIDKEIILTANEELEIENLRNGCIVKYRIKDVIMDRAKC